METIDTGPKQNHILGSLPDYELTPLRDHLERVALNPGWVIHEPHTKIEHVYFPTSGVVSQIFTTSSGTTTELAMTGHNGLIGLAAVLGGEFMTHEAVVRCPGDAYRLRASHLRRALVQGSVLQAQILGYVQALIMEISHGVACNTHHRVEERLARWLLQNADLNGGHQVRVTQETMGDMLGVRREAINEAARKLQDQGLILRHRGSVDITDRQGLEARACECYQSLRHHERMLPAGYHGSGNGGGNGDLGLHKQTHHAECLNQMGHEHTSWPESMIMQGLNTQQAELSEHIGDLRAAYLEIENLKKQFEDLYEYAPMPYFMLGANGELERTNIAGAIMMGIKHSDFERQPFADFLDKNSVAQFMQFYRSVLSGRCREDCDIALKSTAHRPELAVRLYGAPDEDGAECRLMAAPLSQTHRL